MMLLGLSAAGLVLAVMTAVMVAVNLFCYRTPRLYENRSPKLVSILIPARDEEGNIARVVESALASRGVDLEVVVMDDHSTDRTVEIVRTISSRDPRVRVETAPPLPEGWAGKQHACHALAQTAQGEVLLFVDADVEFDPDGIARAVGFLEDSGCDLVSGFPRQITGTWMERLVIPLIHFVLLGYLPLPAMRRSGDELFGAGCGQLFLARRTAYEESGGHAAIRASFHDGLQLPRSFRRAGLATDLFDATRVTTCRMYHDAGAVIRGLAKNAHEGMAGRGAIWVWSAILLLSYVVPPVLVVTGLVMGSRATWWSIALAAAVVGVATRLVLALRFRQSIVGALLHPLGVTILVAIQWYSWVLRRAGRGVAWKDRAQASG
jgi:glycosyltransferase involved in cell wall biosynthesis